MNEEMKNKMEERWARYRRGSRRGRVGAGLILLVVGAALLLRNMDLIWMPWWVFTWPVILIAVGLISGIRHGFRGGFWIIPLIIGGLFLANEMDPSLQLRRYIAPIAIISVGLVFILRPKR